MVAKSGIEPVNGVFAVVFKIKSASATINLASVLVYNKNRWVYIGGRTVSRNPRPYGSEE